MRVCSYSWMYTHTYSFLPQVPRCVWPFFSLPASLWYPKGAWIPYLTTSASIYEHSFFPYMCFRMVFFHVCVFSANASMDSTLEPQGKFFFCGACQSHGCFARFNWPEKCVYVKSVSKKILKNGLREHSVGRQKGRKWNASIYAPHHRGWFWWWMDA